MFIKAGELRHTAQIIPAICKPFFIREALFACKSIDGKSWFITKKTAFVTLLGMIIWQCAILNITKYHDTVEADGKIRETVNYKSHPKKEYASMWTRSELQRQIANNRFKIYFRPHYDMDNISVCSAETFVLHLTDDNALERPSDFLPLLEEMDLVAVLDMWILNQVCKIQQEAFAKGLYICPIYVNISIGTICNPYSIYDIALIHKNFVLPENSIFFSLTSTKMYPDLYGLNKGIVFLQDKGIKIMLSRFGSEFTTFTLFSGLKFDKLQIDRQFFKKAVELEHFHIILKHIMALSDDLNMPVILDGVDNLNEYQYAKTIGGKYARGEFFGMKVADEELVKKVIGDEG